MPLRNAGLLICQPFTKQRNQFSSKAKIEIAVPGKWRSDQKICSRYILDFSTLCKFSGRNKGNKNTPKLYRSVHILTNRINKWRQQSDSTRDATEHLQSNCLVLDLHAQMGQTRRVHFPVERRCCRRLIFDACLRSYWIPETWNRG